MSRQHHGCAGASVEIDLEEADEGEDHEEDGGEASEVLDQVLVIVRIRRGDSRKHERP